MALTENDKERVRRTLGLYAANLEDNMITFYENLLTDCPLYHAKFARLRNVPVADFKTNEWLRTYQGPTVGKSVADLVSKMDDPEALTAAVRKLVVAPLHTKHNLTGDDYLNALKALLKTLQNVLGSQFNQQDTEAWLKLATALTGLFDGEVKRYNDSKPKH